MCLIEYVINILFSSLIGVGAANMTESGIDLGFDLSTYNIADDFDLQNIDFEELLGTPKNQEFYELKSKTMPVTERYVMHHLLTMMYEQHKYTNKLSRDKLLS